MQAFRAAGQPASQSASAAWPVETVAVANAIPKKNAVRKRISNPAIQPGQASRSGKISTILDQDTPGPNSAVSFCLRFKDGMVRKRLASAVRLMLPSGPRIPCVRLSGSPSSSDRRLGEWFLSFGALACSRIGPSYSAALALSRGCGSRTEFPPDDRNHPKTAELEPLPTAQNFDGFPMLERFMGLGNTIQ
jgi:hypothetical protein